MHTASLFAITKLADDRENPTDSLLPASMRTFTTARGEERRAERLGHCSSAHRLHSERWSPVIGAFARVFPPSTRVFAFFFPFPPLLFKRWIGGTDGYALMSFAMGGRVTRVTHCQDTIHDSAVTFAFVRGWTEIRGGIFGFDCLKYETRLEMILFLFF